MYINELNELLTKIFNNLGYETNAKVTKSNRTDLCDYQCSDIFKIAKQYQKNPVELGEELKQAIIDYDQNNNYFSEVSFVKPGFLNLKLSNTFINKYIKITNENIKDTLQLPKKETYVIDYGGPNVAKPLHVGHMRTAIVGESIKRIIKFMGNNIISDIHLGDYGLQIGEVIYAIKEDKKNINDIDITYLEEAYPRISKLCNENPDIKEICAQITKDLQDGNEEYQQIWKKIMEVSTADMKKIYEYLDVHFDVWYGESNAYPYFDAVEKKIKPYLVESEGALVCPISLPDDKKEMPPLIFKKANGAYLYATTDLGTIEQRIQDYNPDHILYVVDNRQSLHFQQLFRTCDKIGLISADKLEHLSYGTVNGSDNKPYKTRNGDTPKLTNLFESAKEVFINKKESNKDMSKEDIDKIVNAILKFADLQNSREKDYIFDLDKFSEIQGKTGPYILYTYLRINKILNMYELKNNITNNIYNEFDRNLRLKLLELPISLTNSFTERKPNYIAEYVYDLAVCANTFYQNNYLNKEEDQVKLNDYLYLLTTTNKVIKELLYLLAIDIPSIM